jgi:hypothetical protein
LWLLIHVSISGQGVFNFVIYGTMSDNYLLWAELIGAKVTLSSLPSSSCNVGNGWTDGCYMYQYSLVGDGVVIVHVIRMLLINMMVVSVVQQVHVIVHLLHVNVHLLSHLDVNDRQPKSVLRNHQLLVLILFSIFVHYD